MVAPFPAPPRERNPRIWITLVVVAAVILLCGGGGVAAFIGYTVRTTNQVKAAADTFLTAIEQQRYGDAYRMQCASARQSQSQSSFQHGFANGPRLVSHQLSAPEGLKNDGAAGFAVPAQLNYADGQSRNKRIVVVPRDSGGGSDMVVCGTSG